jgi:deoxyribodipyrimidine photo-lyase
MRKVMMRSTLFEPTRHAGLARLKTFVASAGRNYQSTRNADLGPTDRSNVSALSPYIRHRLIAEEEVLCAVLNKHTTAAAEKFIQEVFWRSYFKGHLETKPAIWRNYCAALDGLKIQGGLAKAYKAAIIGQSGIDCFDAWVAELIEFGYLHNHARMWFASIWIFTLRLPWELGADFMYRHLLDGDPASNTLSWRWVAGLHTKGKTYLARPDNIETYTQGRFSPTGLARDAVALEEPALPPAQKISQCPENYSGGKIGLLLTEEDLHSEGWGVDAAQVVAVGGASQGMASEPVTQFKTGAMTDGVRRASDKFGVPGEILERLDSEHILTWAKTHTLKTIVTAYAPVGPVAEALAQLKLPDIKVVQLRRAFDSAAWPHSSKGFFAMKEKIPDLLRRIIDNNHPQLSLI